MSARGKTHETAVRFSEVLRNPSLLLVSATLFLFHLGNAAMLPLLGQSAVARFDVNPATYTAATVVLAQATMILMALWAARLAQKKRIRPPFYFGLGGFANQRLHRRSVGQSLEHCPRANPRWRGSRTFGCGNARNCRLAFKGKRTHQYGAGLRVNHSGIGSGAE